MSKTKYEDVRKLIEDADPHDGFGIQEVVLGDSHSLHLVFRQGGVPVDLLGYIGEGKYYIGEVKYHFEVWTCKSPGIAELGKKTRIRLLLEALCRYFNTGGDAVGIDRLVAKFDNVIGEGLDFSIPGFDLMDTHVNADGVYEHLFAADDSPYAIRWVEGEFIDVLNLTDLQKELAADDTDNTGVIGEGPSGFFSGPEDTGRTDEDTGSIG